VSFRPKTTLRIEKRKEITLVRLENLVLEMRSVMCALHVVGLGLATIWTRSHGTNH
jgi:hypothetical protein